MNCVGQEGPYFETVGLTPGAGVKFRAVLSPFRGGMPTMTVFFLQNCAYQEEVEFTLAIAFYSHQCV